MINPAILADTAGKPEYTTKAAGVLVSEDRVVCATYKTRCIDEKPLLLLYSLVQTDIKTKISVSFAGAQTERTEVERGDRKEEGRKVRVRLDAAWPCLPVAP